MSLADRIEKMEPRERRLLFLLLGLLGATLLLAGPIYVAMTVAGKRATNAELRELTESIRSARASILERRAKREAVQARYARPAPALAGFIEEAARANGIAAAESQDRPDTPQGKHFIERSTAIRMHKVSMAPVLRMLEKIEQSGYPVAVTRLNLKPRAGEADSYEVELAVSAFDRKADSAAPAAPSPTETEKKP